MDNLKMTALPIGVFDSGVGGVSVLRELVALMPGESYLSYGDSANAPYGEKSPEWIRARVAAVAAELVARGVKALVIACNTATGVAIEDLRRTITDIPVIGIEPAIKPASLQKESPRVLVMATSVTLAQGKFKELMRRFSDRAEILPLPCPGLVELIESGETGDRLSALLDGLFAPFVPTPPDSLVLGCTHYPLIRDEIRSACARAFGRDDLPILDGGAGTARQVRRQLAARGWLRSDNDAGEITFINTAGDDACKLARSLLARGS